MGSHGYLCRVSLGPKRGIRKGLGEQEQKLEVLRRLGVPKYPIEVIAIEKQRFYARRMRRRRPSRFAELREPRLRVDSPRWPLQWTSAMSPWRVTCYTCRR